MSFFRYEYKAIYINNRRSAAIKRSKESRDSGGGERRRALYVYKRRSRKYRYVRDDKYEGGATCMQFNSTNVARPNKRGGATDPSRSKTTGPYTFSGYMYNNDEAVRGESE